MYVNLFTKALLTKLKLGNFRLNKIYKGNNTELIIELPDNCIDLTVTSPPSSEDSFDLKILTNQLFRITKDGCCVVWVVADDIINGYETGESYKQASYFVSTGFKLHKLYKQKYEHEQRYEYMFVFCKGEIKTSSQMHRDIWYYIWDYHKDYGCSTLDNCAFKHPAVFPDALAQYHILSWSNENDIVFDPFMGSGTVAKMAYVNKRFFLGFEISDEYILLAEERFIKNAVEQDKKENIWLT